MKLFIAIPMLGWVPPEFAISLANLFANPPLEFTLRCLQGGGLCEARNITAADFLASDCTDLLFIDSDLSFAPADVARIASHDVSLVGGMYLKRGREGAELVAMKFAPGEKPEGPPRADKLVEVKFHSTGFLRIRRDVFETLIAKGKVGEFWNYTKQRTEHDFFRMGIHQTSEAKPVWLGEDWMFSQLYREAGGTVWADTGILAKHHGPAAWPLPHQEAALAQMNAQGSAMQQQ